uniref:von Willebrand factor type A n=1 Tax=Chlorobium phaeobacteroides (strain BS1) TaxID=331678 RepID=B3EPA5_CHLPB
MRNMKDLARTIRRIEIRSKRLVNELFSGEYHSSFKGRGIEFSNVREYSWGDDVRAIDWNTSARKNDLYVKIFTEERERTLLLVLDGSGSMLFGSRQRMKTELAAEVCAVLAFSAISNNDKVGLLIFTDRVEKYIPPRKGRSHVLVILEEIIGFTPVSRRTDIDAAIRFIRSTRKRQAIIFLLTDLVDEHYEKAIKILNAKHDFVLIHLDDPLEREIPRSGLLHLRDPETGDTMVFDAAGSGTLSRYRDFRKRQLDGLKKKLSTSNIDAVYLQTNRSITGPLDRFFRYREKKI